MHYGQPALEAFPWSLAYGIDVIHPFKHFSSNVFHAGPITRVGWQTKMAPPAAPGVGSSLWNPRCYRFLWNNYDLHNTRKNVSTFLHRWIYSWALCDCMDLKSEHYWSGKLWLTLLVCIPWNQSCGTGNTCEKQRMPSSTRQGRLKSVITEENKNSMLAALEGKEIVERYRLIF